MQDFPIHWYPSKKSFDDCKFSIIIPSWNNLEMLKCCIKSIEKNSRLKHQIIIHVNEGEDGTHEWVRKQGYDHTYSQTNTGVCWAVNACRTLVQTDYILYLNDDMYVLPDWDYELWKQIEILPDNRFFLSATMIEPTPSPHPGIIAPYGYGRDPNEFQEDKLLKEYKNLPSYDWAGATWPPNVVHKQIWDLVGGYSIEYFPGMYSDPDFSMKLIKAGVKHFKGVAASKVYHFGSKSTKRVKKNHGNKQFLNKWGITSSVLTKTILKRGAPFEGELSFDTNTSGYKKVKLKSKLKRIFWSLTPTGQVDEL